MIMKKTGVKMKLCKDCVYCETFGGDLEFARCLVAKNEIDLVTGEIKYGFCSVDRCISNFDSFFLGTCGKSGRHYREKS